MKINYDYLLDIDKIKDAYSIIRRNTKNKGKLFKFELYYTSNIIHILDLLERRKYCHGHYNIFLIQEPKYRIIMSEVLIDKIVNHLLSKYVLVHFIYPKLIAQNVATRKDKGTKEGIRYVKKYLNKLKLNYDEVYVLKCDIKKYFYNIDHEIILNKLKEIIDDKEILDLLESIICSTDSSYVNETIKKTVYNEINRINNIDILDREKKIEELRGIPYYKPGKGLPIGNMTSQILAIYYLNDLDHFIKEKLHCKYYIRYMDDLILFDFDKENLKKIKMILFEKIKEYKLEFNNKTNIFKVSNGFNFLGYNFVLKNKKLIIKINSQTKRRIKKKMKKLKQDEAANYELVVASYKGYFKIANAKALTYKIFK